MAKPIGSKNIKWDKTNLEKLYWEQGLSSVEIGKIMGITDAAVRAAMARLGIKLRRMAEVTKAERHYNWKGGRYAHKDGYIYVRAEGHPRASKRNYVFEHILIVEKQLGRYLRKDETVHHLNGIKTDNRIENLVVLRQQDHNRVIPLLKQRIRELENEIKCLSQSVMKL